jgi:hypothetical protein
MLVMHFCGEIIEVSWKGIENPREFTFWKPHFEKQIKNCPKCGYWLFASDIGTSLLKKQGHAEAIYSACNNPLPKQPLKCKLDAGRK